MRVSAVVLFFVALASKVTAQMNYTVCPTGTAFNLTSVNWSPSPACVGKQLCAVGTGILTEPIMAPASLTFTVKYFGRVIFADTYDFCAMLAAQGTPCPIPAGHAVLKGCVPIRPTTPANVINQTRQYTKR